MVPAFHECRRRPEWQEQQDPDTNVDPEQNLYVWDGRFTPNQAVMGKWKAVDQVDARDAFDPAKRQRPSRGWRPQFDELAFGADVRTGNPLLVWTGSKLLNAGRREALAVVHERIGEKDYLFIEIGGFNTDRAVGWTSPWLVFEKQ
jgi:hypothetical protein